MTSYGFCSENNEFDDYPFISELTTDDLFYEGFNFINLEKI
jgi:hypothetical protein